MSLQKRPALGLLAFLAFSGALWHALEGYTPAGYEPTERIPAGIVDPEGCSLAFTKVNEDFYGTQVPVYRFAQGQEVNLSKLFDGQQVFLGVKDPHHYYLTFGTKRLDANPMDFPWVDRDPSGVIGDRGLAIRIKDVPQRVMKEIRENLAKAEDTAAFSCVNGACRVLKRSGIEIGDLTHTPVTLAPTLEGILKNGFRTKDGKVLDFDVFAIDNPKSLEQFHGELAHDDERIMKLTARKFRGTNLNQAPQKIIGKPTDPEDEQLFFALVRQNESDLAAPSKSVAQKASEAAGILVVIAMGNSGKAHGETLQTTEAPVEPKAAKRRKPSSLGFEGLRRLFGQPAP